MPTRSALSHGFRHRAVPDVDLHKKRPQHLLHGLGGRVLLRLQNLLRLLQVDRGHG